LRVNFGKIEGPKCKICKTGPRVDFKETQGLLCKMAGNFGWGFIFQRIKSWAGSMHPWTGRACSVRHGPTAARTEGGPGHSGALTGARPPTAPVHQSSPVGVQQREERSESLARATPGLGRRHGDRAMAVAQRGESQPGQVPLHSIILGLMPPDQIQTMWFHVSFSSNFRGKPG
jgi:hypothetical protein